MRVIQLLPVLHFGDAVGNHTVALYETLKKAGYQTEIYTGNIDKGVYGNIAKPLETLEINEKDIAILHLAIGTELNYEFANYPCKKILVYHNITPPNFFGSEDRAIAEFSRKGLESVAYLADKVDYCLAVSEFNKNDLIKMGYKCPIDVMPILIPFSDYEKKPDKQTMERYSDGKTNLVFVGRVVQNKKQEDVIEAFAYYQKYYDNNARLFIVGGYDEAGSYYKYLKSYVHKLGVNEVVFTNKIAFSELLAYYNLADCFLCMSEHEGFCVPVVESMYFHVPVIAYNACAVPDTLGKGGIILDKKEPLITAGVINRIITDCPLRENIISNQNEQMRSFEHDVIEKKFLYYLEQFIAEN
ncbi:glycosyltransferase family 4 protein [Clostridium sp. WB02_MRS01]|uniref:glycosyltransferase family 4 protein n=1 Tax=Clostridium sp. WB02_MRS01 TaxID=2605777 RepID=UPI0012B1ACDE|nr:glycosyltransferase family 4 protein [Clostridium sp. WB02_MRS01]MSS10799.1 glycosyltransferase family 4 protein [Clostridium sp. WB02_MRS01]